MCACTDFAHTYQTQAHSANGEGHVAFVMDGRGGLAGGGAFPSLP